MSNTINYNNKLEGFQKNSKTLLVIVYDASANLMDLTNYDASLYMQKFPIRAGNTIDVGISQTSIDASNGAIMFDLSQTDLSINAGDYIYEVIIDDGSTNRHTVIQDKLNLKDSIV